MDLFETIVSDGNVSSSFLVHLPIAEIFIQPLWQLLAHISRFLLSFQIPSLNVKISVIFHIAKY